VGKRDHGRDDDRGPDEHPAGAAPDHERHPFGADALQRLEPEDLRVEYERVSDRLWHAVLGGLGSAVDASKPAAA
jgi:hypothetical protein